MTLIELLLVLLIIGLGWFTLLPKLDLGTPGEQDNLKQVNDLLFHAGLEAVRNHALQTVSCTLGQQEMHWKGQTASLPAPLSKLEINGEQATGTKAVFRIYPTGHMDQLSLRLSGGKQLRSQPLARKLRIEP